MMRFSSSELPRPNFPDVVATVTAVVLVAILVTPASAQQGNRSIPRNQTDPRALQVRSGDQQQAQQNAVQVARAQSAKQNSGNVKQVAAVNPNVAPFPPLAPAAMDRLQKLLNAWEQQSKSTKTLTCKFEKWHYDLLAAPAGVHATKSAGVIKYAAPDQGLYRTDSLLFYNRMEKGKPQYGAHAGKVGDYWVCNGREVIEFDGNEKKCTVTELPAAMRGQNILNSPLPFVFNLDAKKIQERYWVREVKAPKEGIYLIEAWPKHQQDRAQYRLVQIALDDQQFLPHALIMYAPNFNAKTTPIWDHYQFSNVKKNGLVDSMSKFMQNFVPQRPPSDWKVVREKMPIAGDMGAQAQKPSQVQQR